jgi:hypothetical protein
VIGQLALNFPTTVYNDIPKGSFNYGGGGVNAWRSICGSPNGGSALLKQMGAPTAVMDEYMAWYEKTLLPSNAAYEDFAGGTWTPQGGVGALSWVATSANTSTQITQPIANAPMSVAQGLLCHSSHGRWLAAAGGAAGAWVANVGTIQGVTNAAALSAAGSDRCSKLVYDCVFKLATLINAWKAGTLPAGTLDPSATATGCMNTSCHGATYGDYPIVAGKMKCTDSCHK